MRNIVIGIIGKYLGINKALEWVNGYGTYLAGGGIMLMGAAQVLIDLAPVIATKDPAALAAFVSSLPANPGAHKFLEGLAVIRLRMAVAKPALVEANKPL